MLLRLLGYALVAAALVLAGAAVYLGGIRHEVPLVFSPTQVLGATWNNYKAHYLEQGTFRTLDPSRGNVTTSEGESYTMLRAVWMDDKATFDQSWQWTKNNLSRPGDRLSAWEFGQRTDGSYGILTQLGGENNATDADEDIALSLVFAYARWQDKNYLGDARVIASDIWDKDVIEINGTPYLTADNVEKTSKDQTALINISYFNPAAYRIFAVIDPGHPWQKLIDSSYTLAARAIEASLGTTSAGLPPDWMLINKETGALSAPTNAGETSNYSFDALRLPWRLALDWQWNADQRDQDLLNEMNFLGQTWRESGSLASAYGHDGSVVTSSEAPSMYGGSMGYFATVDTEDAPAVYAQKLQYLWNPDTNAWIEPLSYYDDNWAWFGIGLYNKLLPNLFSTLPIKLYEL